MVLTSSSLTSNSTSSRSRRSSSCVVPGNSKRPPGRSFTSSTFRPSSATFGKWVGASLSGENFRQMFIPPGFAHGFCVLSGSAEVEYKCTDFYDRADEIGVRWDSAGIEWPIQDPLLSPKDAALPTLLEIREALES